MGIFSSSVEIRLELVEIKKNTIVLSISRQLFDGPCPIDSVSTNLVVMKQGEKRTIS